MLAASDKIKDIRIRVLYVDVLVHFCVSIDR